MIYIFLGPKTQTIRGPPIVYHLDIAWEMRRQLFPKDKSKNKRQIFFPAPFHWWQASQSYYVELARKRKEGNLNLFVLRKRPFKNYIYCLVNSMYFLSTAVAKTGCKSCIRRAWFCIPKLVSWILTIHCKFLWIDDNHVEHLTVQNQSRIGKLRLH